MRTSSSTVLAGTQAPAVEVRNHSGELVGRVPPAKADELIAAGLVSPIGRNGIKYVVLNCDEPILERPWRGGNHTTTRPVTADHTCVHYVTGQPMGNPRMLREHKPLPRES